MPRQSYSIGEYTEGVRTAHCLAVVASMTVVPKPMAPVSLMNTVGFAAWLDPDGEPEESLQLEELVNMLVLLNKESHDQEWFATKRQQPRRSQVPAARSTSRTAYGSEWVVVREELKRLAWFL